jgi:uncharacterized protein
MRNSRAGSSAAWTWDGDRSGCQKIPTVKKTPRPRRGRPRANTASLSYRERPVALFFALLLTVVLLACWMLTLVGMPGNWLMVVATAIYAYFMPAAFGWKVVVIVAALAAFGEIIELLAGAMGAAKAGGSRRGALMALVGSILGGIVGVFMGIPIPLVGPILAAVLFGGLGALVGAILGETWAGRDLSTSWQVAKLAFWGRLAGTLGKMLVGATIVAVVVAAHLL